MGGCQDYGPFLGTLNIRCRIKIGTQKGTIILTIPHIYFWRKLPFRIPKIKGTLLVVPIIRIIIGLGIYGGSSLLRIFRETT